MKRQFLHVIIVACLIADGCAYDDLGSYGVITGYDPRYCACCGGLMINFQNITEPFSGDFYLIENSSDLNLPVNVTFPISAIVTYSLSGNTCGGKHIHVNSFKRVR